MRSVGNDLVDAQIPHSVHPEHQVRTVRGKVVGRGTFESDVGERESRPTRLPRLVPRAVSVLQRGIFEDERTQRVADGSILFERASANVDADAGRVVEDLPQ